MWEGKRWAIIVVVVPQEKLKGVGDTRDDKWWCCVGSRKQNNSPTLKFFHSAILGLHVSPLFLFFLTFLCHPFSDSHKFNVSTFTYKKTLTWCPHPFLFFSLSTYILFIKKKKEKKKEKPISIYLIPTWTCINLCIFSSSCVLTY